MLTDRGCGGCDGWVTRGWGESVGRGTMNGRGGPPPPPPPPPPVNVVMGMCPRGGWLCCGWDGGAPCCASCCAAVWKPPGSRNGAGGRACAGGSPPPPPLPPPAAASPPPPPPAIHRFVCECVCHERLIMMHGLSPPPPRTCASPCCAYCRLLSCLGRRAQGRLVQPVVHLSRRAG